MPDNNRKANDRTANDRIATAQSPQTTRRTSRSALGSTERWFLLACALGAVWGCGGQTQPASASPAAPADTVPTSTDSSAQAADSGGVADAAETDTNEAGGPLDEEGAQDSDDDAAETETPLEGPCPAYVTPIQVGALGDPRLDELSGLVASRQHDDVLWAHNDSGEKHARFFALDGTGALRMVLRLGNLVPTDTEDIAIGPCSSTGGGGPAACLYLGDVGDNDHIRPEVQAYRVAEPADVAAAGSDSELKVDESTVEILRWTYPPRPELKGKARAASERPDVEAMVALADGRIVLLDKRDDGVTELFRVQPSTTPSVAERIGTVALADGALVSGPSLRVTAADLSDDGSQLLVRCYFRAYQIDVADLLLADAATASAALPDRPRLKLTTGFDVQGEAATWARQGGFWHASEGESAPVFFVGCATPK